jgi:hypothetical protein
MWAGIEWIRSALGASEKTMGKERRGLDERARRLAVQGSLLDSC